jgi:cholera toxin transcriptional activator
MTRNYLLGNQMVFDVLRREISTDEHVVSIGGREAVILKLLCDNVNRVLSKEEIQEIVWGRVFVSETSLTKAISNLRKSLVQFESLACEIKTVSKEGYMLILDEDTTDLFITKELSILEVKNIMNRDSIYFNNFSILSYFMKKMVYVRTEFKMKNLFFILLCFFSALLAAILTVTIINFIR